MKKIILLFALAVLAALQYANSQAPIDKDCEGIKRDRFELLSYKESRKNVRNYWKNFKDASLYTRAIYIDRQTIKFLYKFFQNRPDDIYLGAQLHFGINNIQPGTGQSSKIALYFAAIKKVGNRKESDFTAFADYLNQPGIEQFPKDLINSATFCPGLCDSSLMDWNNIASYDRLEQISDKDKIGILFNSLANIVNVKSNYLAETSQFDRRKKKHTFFISYTRETFLRLGEFFEKDVEGKFPAAAIYFESYNKMADKKYVYGQGHRKQITAGFVPMQRIGKYLEPDPCSYINYWRRFSENIKNTDNHGELCPKICN